MVPGQLGQAGLVLCCGSKAGLLGMLAMLGPATVRCGPPARLPGLGWRRAESEAPSGLRSPVPAPRAAGASCPVWLWSQHCGPPPGRRPSALRPGRGSGPQPESTSEPIPWQERAEQHPSSWPGARPPPTCSDLSLEVDDVLAHQRDRGARLLPLHAPQLQRGRWQWLQLLLHPRGCPVGFPKALPGPLVGRLLLLRLLAMGGGGGRGRGARGDRREQGGEKAELEPGKETSRAAGQEQRASRYGVRGRGRQPAVKGTCLKPLPWPWLSSGGARLFPSGLPSPPPPDGPPEASALPPLQTGWVGAQEPVHCLPLSLQTGPQELVHHLPLQTGIPRSQCTLPPAQEGPWACPALQSLAWAGSGQHLGKVAGKNE